jgi:preprotein translocase subunit SecF
MKKIIILFIFTIFSTNSFAAGSDSNSTSKVKSNYDKAVTLIKSAKKYEKKGKIEKANKRYKKAQALLIKSNNKKPNQSNNQHIKANKGTYKSNKSNKQ